MRNCEFRGVDKAAVNSVKSALLKGLPTNGFSSASQNMTQSTPKCVLVGSLLLTSAGSKLAAAETKVGAGMVGLLDSYGNVHICPFSVLDKVSL